MRGIPLEIAVIWGIVEGAVVSAAIRDPVHLDRGLVSGVSGFSPDVRVYKGIRFAAPPVGNLRWRAPQPVARWNGVRKADQFGPMCMQNEPGSSRQPMSEDCLYLNVWTAAKSAGERRPVMVWIYGGANNRGSGAQPEYDGEPLARKGVVVVTFNYRLGAFGFFSHPELTKESDRHASGNYGLMDQVAALQWVQKNIPGFGGDPKRVAVFGQSAGSSDIASLMASPQAKGLFQRAIGESGAWTGIAITRMKGLAEAEQAGVKLAEGLGARSLAELRAMTADALKATRGTQLVIDGWLVPENPGTIFAQGKQNSVPLLVGSNRDEGADFVQRAGADRFIEAWPRRFGDLTGAFLKLYPMGSADEAIASLLRASSDEAAWVMRNWARLETKTGKAKAYIYYFTHEPPVAPGGGVRGATHMAEIPYVFHNLTGNLSWTDLDHQLSDIISSYWVNFAANGDPNGKGLPKWPAYDDNQNKGPMALGDRVEVGPAPDGAQLALFQALYDRQH